MVKRTPSPVKLISWVDYSLFHSTDLNWIKGSVSAALVIHAWALRILMEFVPPSGLLYLLVNGGLALGGVLSLVVLATPLLEEIQENWKEKFLAADLWFLLGIVLLFLTSLAASILYLPWVYYEIIPTALAIHAIGRYWLFRKRRYVADALPVYFDRVERCNRVEPDGSVMRIPLADLKVGEEIKVSPSQIIPVDGVVATGEAYVSEASLNGSTFPTVKQPGDPILAGSVSLDGVITIKALSSYVARKIQPITHPLLAEPTPHAVNRFSRFGVPAIMGGLASIAFGYGLYTGGLFIALVQVSCVFMVGTTMSWVCGVPVHYWTGLVHMAKRSLYGRHPSFVSDLAKVDHAFFGKTGVISGNELRLETIFVLPAFQDREDWILSMVYQTSRLIQHPLVNPLKQVENLIDGKAVVEELTFKVIAGSGVEANLTDGLGKQRTLRIGEEAFILGHNGRDVYQSILEEHDLTEGRRIWLSLDGRLCAIAKLKEAWNITPQPYFNRLESFGIRPAILTSDSDFDDTRLEGLLCEQGLSAYDKQLRVEAARREGATVMFVGDGLNDYRAMSRANVSIALRHAPDPLLAKADAILASKKLSLLIFAIPFCRRIVRLSKRNQLYFSLAAVAASLCVLPGWFNPLYVVLYTFAATLVVWFQSIILSSTNLAKIEIKPREPSDHPVAREFASQRNPNR